MYHLSEKKESLDVVDIIDYDIRVRKSSENEINSIKDSKKIMDNLKSSI